MTPSNSESSAAEKYTTKQADPKTADYWAAQDAKRCMAEAQQRKNNYYMWMQQNGRRAVLSRTWTYYNLISVFGAAIQKVGAKAQYALFLVDEFRSLVEQLQQIIIGSRPLWKPVATNADSKSLKQTRVARNALDYFMRRKAEKQLYRAVELAALTGESYIKLVWDAKAGRELTAGDQGFLAIHKRIGTTDQQILANKMPRIFDGDAQISAHSGYDVARDIHATSPDQVKWRILREPVNKYDLAARYPHHAQAILNCNYKPSQNYNEDYRMFVMRAWTSDDVLVNTLYHDITAAVPKGREMSWIDRSDVMLEDKPLGYELGPLHRMVFAEYDGTSIGTTPVFSLCPLQEMLCNIHSAIASLIRAYGLPSVYSQAGSMISEANYTEGFTLLQGTSEKAPELIQLLEIKAEMMQYADRIISAMERMVGLSGAIRGQGPTDSGSALAMASTLAVQNNAKSQANYSMLLESTGTAYINMEKDYAETPRIVQIVGEDGKTYLEQMRGSDMKGILKTVADIGNPITNTPQGKYQTAQMFAQTGQCTPAQLAEVIQSGRLEPVSDNTEDEQIRILEENEALEFGDVNQVLVELTDDDDSHGRQHAAVLKRVIARIGDNTKALQDPRYQAVMNHIKAHVTNSTSQALIPFKQMLGLPSIAANQQAQQGGQHAAPPAGGPAPGPTGGQPAKQPKPPGEPKGSSQPSLPGAGSNAPKNNPIGQPPPSGA